jgi:hypothetical protein
MLLNRTICAIALLLLTGSGWAQELHSIEANRVKLPNGWSLTPVGKSLPLGDLPLNIAVSRSHRYAAITNNGQSIQTIQLLDAKNDIELDNVTIGKAWGGGWSSVTMSKAFMPPVEIITGSFVIPLPVISL